MRSRIPLAAAALALIATPAIARAQVRPESGAEPAIELAPPAGRIHSLREALEWIVWMDARIVQRQRFGPRDGLEVPPHVTGPATSPWLPDIRTGPLRGEAVWPIAAGRGLVVAPFATETLNTQVAEARGSDGLAVGIRITLPTFP